MLNARHGSLLCKIKCKFLHVIHQTLVPTLSASVLRSYIIFPCCASFHLHLFLWPLPSKVSSSMTAVYVVKQTWIEKVLLKFISLKGLLLYHNSHSCGKLDTALSVRHVKTVSIIHNLVPSFYAFNELLIIAALRPLKPLHLHGTKTTSRIANGLMRVNWDRKKELENSIIAG